MKIGIVFDDSLDRNDGVQQYIKTVGTYFLSQGHEVVYLVGQTDMKVFNGIPVRSLAKNLQVSFNRNRMSMPRPVPRKVIRRVLQEEACDVLYVQMPYSPFMAGRIITEAPATTLVAGMFHIVGATKPINFANRLLGIYVKRSLKRITKMWSTSKAAQEYALRFYGIQTEVMPNAVELKRFIAGAAKAEVTEIPHIVFLGRLVERKGARELIEAIHVLADTGHPFRVTIAGDGPERQALEKLVTQYHLKKKITFAGFINEEDKPALLRSAYIAVFPSLYGESFGIVLLEAMASGAGVTIGGNNPGYACVLEPWKETLFDPRDTQAFALLLGKLLSDYPLAVAIHDSQMKAVRAYDITVIGSQLLEAFQAHSKPAEPAKLVQDDSSGIMKP